MTGMMSVIDAYSINVDFPVDVIACEFFCVIPCWHMSSGGSTLENPASWY